MATMTLAEATAAGITVTDTAEVALDRLRNRVAAKGLGDRVEVRNMDIATQGIREDDAKGRHTTTRRELHATPGGCLVLDTPGMRELQLTDAATGIADVFEDIEALAAHCRFTDCRHETEPGCAVEAAIEDGSLDPARLARWRTLRAEDAFNSASLVERREKDRAFGKLVRSAVKAKSDRAR